MGSNGRPAVPGCHATQLSASPVELQDTLTSKTYVRVINAVTPGILVFNHYETNNTLSEKFKCVEPPKSGALPMGKSRKKTRNRQNSVRSRHAVSRRFFQWVLFK